MLLKVNPNQNPIPIAIPDGGGGSGSFNVVPVSANYNAQFGDLVVGDPSGASFTVTLPAASSVVAGGANAVVVKNESSSANIVTVALTGGDTIDDITGSISLSARDALFLVSDGVGNWIVIAEYSISGGGGPTQSVGATALQFLANEGQEQAVPCGPFWPQSTDLGPCLWEAWVQPYGLGTKIIVTDGYGGLHAVLLEMSQQGSNNRVSGNMQFVPGAVSFTSYDGLYPNEPGHVGLIYDPTGDLYNPPSIYLFLNGLCSAAVPAAGARRTQDAIGGIMAIGGYGHTGWSGLIQQVRAWDSVLSAPITLPRAGNSYMIWPQGPESIFSPWVLNDDGTLNPCSFLMSFCVPDPQPKDLSQAGFLGKFHPGALMNTNLQGVTSPGYAQAYPRPVYVGAPSLPGQLATVAVSQPIVNPPATKPVPPGCLVFDGYTHGWNTKVWDKQLPQLPATQGGSLGPLPYVIQHSSYPGINDAAPWGTDNSGNAVCMSPQRAVAAVDVGTPDMDVRISRVGPKAPLSLNGETGFAFRVQDAHNFYYLSCFYDPFAGNAMSLWLFQVVNGNDGPLDGGGTFEIPTPNDTFTTIRVVAKGTTFKVYIDDGAGGWIQVGADILGQTTYQTATKVGPFHTSSTVFGATSMRRYTDFTVYAAP